MSALCLRYFEWYGDMYLHPMKPEPLKFSQTRARDVVIVEKFIVPCRSTCCVVPCKQHCPAFGAQAPQSYCALSWNRSPRCLTQSALCALQMVHTFYLES